MSMQVDIGKVSAISVNHDWRLDLKAAVSFSCANNSSVVRQDDLLSWLKQCSPWMSRGNGLQLVLEVDASSFPSHERQTGNMIKALGEAVLNAKLWRQLRLDVSVVDHSPPRITLDVRYAVNTDVAEPKRLHSLPVATSPADVRPPIGVEKCLQERITLTIALRKQDQEVQGARERLTHPSTLIPKLSCSNAHVEDQQDAEPVLSQEDGMLDNDSAQILEESPVLFDICERSSSSPRARPDHSLDHSTDPSTSLVLRNPTFAVLDAKDAIDLADAAIRSIICPRPSKLALGVWLPDSEPSLSLVRLAPILWAPGYAMAVAERACFLPTISHALCHSLSKRARSAGLKEKLAKLQRMSTAHDGHDKPDAEVFQKSFSELVTARLWKMIQQGVYKEDAARSLKPLASTSDTAATGDQEMLEGMQDHKEEAETTTGLIVNSASPGRQEQVGSSSTTRSPILQGRLNLPTNRVWDGGLLAQPFHGFASGLLETRYHVGEMQEQDEDDDDDLFNNDEDEYEDEMLSLFGMRPEDDDFVSIASVDSLLNNDETPFSSQESALARQLAQQNLHVVEEDDMFESTCEMTKDRLLQHPLHAHDAMDLDLLEDADGADDVDNEDMFGDLEDDDMLAF